MYLGRHTCLSWLRDEAELGAVPAFVIAAGDRRRVARVLSRLDEAVDLAAHAQRVIGPAAAGRVALGTGRTGGVPVLAVETQMGGPATEIILREVLDPVFHPEGARAVIRVGTSGALGGGDLAIAAFASGWSGAAEQSRRGVLGPPAEFEPGRPPHPPHLPCSPELVEALRTAAPDAILGGVFSKDSLYAEQDEGFTRILRDLGCVATEMELATIGPVAQELGIAWGGIMASAGCLEGEAWLDADSVESNELRAIDAALAAIRSLAH
jgi:uridine phosphorylase